MGTSIPPLASRHAAAALHALERRQEIMANNLANVSTDGFKGERSFVRALDDVGTLVVDAVTDARIGAITRTGGALDVALGRADAFFVVDTPDGERLTRGGSWQLGADGALRDALGAPLLGDPLPPGIDAGPIHVPADTRQLQVGDDGTVHADGRLIGRLRVERRADGALPAHAGDGRFVAPPDRESVAPADRRVLAGSIEASNVDPVSAMVDMIGIQRAYGAVHRALSLADTTRGLAATDLAKPV
jgi:flagellar basal body rod protein FlgG